MQTRTKINLFNWLRNQKKDLFDSNGRPNPLSFLDAKDAEDFNDLIADFGSYKEAIEANEVELLKSFLAERWARLEKIGRLHNYYNPAYLIDQVYIKLAIEIQIKQNKNSLDYFDIIMPNAKLAEAKVSRSELRAQNRQPKKKQKNHQKECWITKQTLAQLKIFVEGIMHHEDNIEALAQFQDYLSSMNPHEYQALMQMSIPLSNQDGAVFEDLLSNVDMYTDDIARFVYKYTPKCHFNAPKLHEKSLAENWGEPGVETKFPDHIPLRLPKNFDCNPIIQAMNSTTKKLGTDSYINPSKLGHYYIHLKQIENCINPLLDENKKFKQVDNETIVNVLQQLRTELTVMKNEKDGLNKFYGRFSFWNKVKEFVQNGKSQTYRVMEDITKNIANQIMQQYQIKKPVQIITHFGTHLAPIGIGYGELSIDTILARAINNQSEPRPSGSVASLAKVASSQAPRGKP